MTIELAIAAGSLEQIATYIEAGATAVLIGEPRFGARLPGAILEQQLAEAVEAAHRRGAKIYVAVNKLLRNQELDGLGTYLRTAVEAGVDAVVFGDPAVLMSLREEGITIPLHWNAEMTGTNSAAAAYWGRKGATRTALPRELNEEEIADLKAKSGLEVQVQVHGMTNIYHSQRNLLQSYMEHLGKEASLIDLGPDEGRFLIEAERPGERLPVYEDENGTHIMSMDDICLLEAVPALLVAGVDSLYVESLLKPEAYNVAVLRTYREVMDSWNLDPDYVVDDSALDLVRELQDPQRELSFGFLYKEQVY